jgi:hypothetical protein
MSWTAATPDNLATRMRETILAITQRAKAAGLSWYADYPELDGTTPRVILWQGAYSNQTGCFPIRKPIYLRMQEDVELLAPYFVRSTPTYPSASLPTMFTASTLLSDAGLSSGWRRVDSWAAYPTYPPSFSYGQVQHGDIHGRWLLDDIQACLSLLTTTKHTGTLTPAGGKNASSGYRSTQALAESHYDANWPASWEAGDVYIAYYRAYLDAGSSWFIYGEIQRGSASVELAPPAPCAASATPYAMLDRHISGGTYWNPDGLPEDLYSAFPSVAIAALDESAQLAPLSSYDGDPYRDSGVSALTSDADYGSRVTGVFWLIIWVFANG